MSSTRIWLAAGLLVAAVAAGYLALVPLLSSSMGSEPQWPTAVQTAPAATQLVRVDPQERVVAVTQAVTPDPVVDTTQVDTKPTFVKPKPKKQKPKKQQTASQDAGSGSNAAAADPAPQGGGGTPAVEPVDPGPPPAPAIEIGGEDGGQADGGGDLGITVGSG